MNVNFPGGARGGAENWPRSFENRPKLWISGFPARSCGKTDQSYGFPDLPPNLLKTDQNYGLPDLPEIF